ncbi:MAG: hypothetical protein FWC14_04335 [Candidatus Bathyarchaeota archaeon]|uniref:hypothetical protein n=2 Tax=Candidatus Bathycorpusculum sp. TaxID=2994959 RepID=UPI00282CBCDD|nr:hypothetical protein [Candidatus Termiticorpusculum sp.]
MLKMYESRLLLNALGLLISSCIERIITFFITTQMVLEPLIYHVISLVLLVVLFFGTNILLKRIMISDFMCRKMLGKEYIAGRWIEMTYSVEKKDNVEKNDNIGYCCLDIAYEKDGRLTIIATNYDLDLNTNYKFNSKETSFEKYILDYMYTRYKHDGTRTPDWGTIFFQPNTESPPTFYTGTFKRDNEPYRFTGFLIKDKNDLKLLDKDFRGNFHKVFCKYSKVGIE